MTGHAQNQVKEQVGRFNYTRGMPGRAGVRVVEEVVRSNMFSTMRRRGFTSKSRPSGTWMAWICFMIPLSSDANIRSPLLCRTRCTLSGMNVVAIFWVTGMARTKEKIIGCLAMDLLLLWTLYIANPSVANWKFTSGIKVNWISYLASAMV